MSLKDLAKKALSRGAEECGKAVDKAGAVKDGVTDVVSGAAVIVTEGGKIVTDKVSEKVREQEAENARKPSTGSSILDMFVPAVPNTKATKPKADKIKKPRPPQA